MNKRRKKKTIQVYEEDWKQIKQEAVAQDISIADLIEKKEEYLSIVN